MTAEAYNALTMLAIFSPSVCALFIAILRMVFSNIVNFFLRTGEECLYMYLSCRYNLRQNYICCLSFVPIFILLPIASYSLNMLMRYILANILKSL